MDESDSTPYTLRKIPSRERRRGETVAAKTKQGDKRDSQDGIGKVVQSTGEAKPVLPKAELADTE